MSSISTYVLIFSTVVLFGYSLSQFIDSSASLQRKVASYRQLLASFDEPLDNTRKVNWLQNLFLLAGYVCVAYWAGFFRWVLVMIAVKLIFSCVLSDRMQRLVLNSDESVSRPFYVLHKTDSFLNGLLSLFMLLALVL